MNPRRAAVLLAVQHALLGEVAGHLRAVTVRFGEADLHMNCYFDGEVQEVDAESISCVETELIALFPQSHRISHEIFRMDFPEPIPKYDTFAFLRKEA